MSAVATSDPIETLLQAIGARLPGPARPREEILAELRDGLIEVADANERRGLGRAEAVRLAVRQFGDAPPLPPAFSPEMPPPRPRQSTLAFSPPPPITPP